MCPLLFNRVRLSWLAFACVGVVLIDDSGAAEIEPYEARVTAPRALVLSGPGEKFYPTGTLAPGEIVEVYREQAGGWLGIRPPTGSFSAVSEKQVAPGNGDLAEVCEDEVSSRIGSQLSDRRNAVQVRLKRGEVVQIIGKESVDGETWCKIAPPAGEFRWIHAASVERSGPISKSTASDAVESPVVPASATTDSASTQAEAGATATGESAAEPPATNDDKWRASAIPVAPTTAAGVEPKEVVPPPLAPLTTSKSSSAEPVRPTDAPAVPTPAPAATPSGSVGFDLPRQLTEIELRLSRMASAPPQLWNTERLQRDAEQLLSQARTQADRDAVKVTIGKIDKFTTLAGRYQDPSGRGGAGESGRMVTNQISSSPPLPVSPPGHDAVGILRPVVSKRPGAPQFALVDERGQVVTFVTPTPDVNLQPYLGRRVGIAGNRGFIPEFNRAHVTAGRVTPLNQGMMR